ncbi:helix-turn-helix domain-containing protein [Streptomyces sp. TG1A-8]|uniref:helix-turn-helix domain-containing protein n=1 Tax=Streptomyces sp. TG1A-8 TaxID=3051385 RepID=UPI00265BD168|nr:helix-turn-helix domain-containing protein [Streptomyces sp. TG1A-8]MDO0928864.1 helix-turn-helix domain-containing protein [Streptomyces sp. TG1A-8]
MLEQPHFGRRLRKLRLERGLSQVQVAGDGMSTGYLSRLESGERRPNDRVVAHLAQRLGVDVTVLSRHVSSTLSEALAAAASAPAAVDSTTALLQAIDDDERTDPAARWQALWMLSRINNRNGDHERELDQLKELVELSDLLTSPELRVRARVGYARCLRALGDMKSAEPAATQALDIARTQDLSVGDCVAALMVLISVEAESGAMDSAVRHVQELEEKWLPASVPAQAAEALWTAAMVSTRQGDFPAAKSRLERALELVEGKDNLGLWMRLRAAATAAALQMMPAHIDSARRWLSEAEPAVELIGTPLQAKEIRSLQAHLAFHEGRLRDARRLCDQLLGDDGPRLSYRDGTRLRALSGRLMILEGQADEGIATLQRLGQQATESKNLDLAAQIWHSLATTLAEVHQNATCTPSATGARPAE